MTSKKHGFSIEPYLCFWPTFTDSHMRNVIFSHNLFKEGLEAFHPVAGAKLYSNAPLPSRSQTKLYGYLLLDFKLTTDWKFDSFVVGRSIEVCHGICDSIGQERVKSFVSPVLLPSWVNKCNGHLYLQGLAAILSFGTSRPVYSPRNDWLLHEENYVEVQSFFHENINNLGTIKNIKVLIKTNDGNEIEGRFENFRAFPDQSASEVKWSVRANFEGGAYIAFFLGKCGNIISMQEHEGISIETAVVLKMPDLREFSMLNPIMVRGAGAPVCDVHSDVLAKWKQELEEVFRSLFNIKYEADSKEELDYCKSVQAMRLIQLAHQNHREDFDLSFALLVAAVEAIAQIAIPPEQITDLPIGGDAELADLAKKHPNHSEWKRMQANQQFMASFYERYEQLRQYVKNEVKNRNLAKRFVEFILKYCPVEEWEIIDSEVMRHGFAEDRPFKFGYDQIRERSERKPEHFGEPELATIIKNTYRYRSNFFHTGKSTPHNKPESDPTDRFFEEVYNSEEWAKLRVKLDQEERNEITPEEGEKTKTYLVSHTLMAMMAKKSLYNFLLKTDNAES